MILLAEHGHADSEDDGSFEKTMEDIVTIP